MKEQKAEAEETKKEQKTDQQEIDRGVRTVNPQSNTAEKNSGQLRTGEDREARSANNDTVGIP